MDVPHHPRYPPRYDEQYPRRQFPRPPTPRDAPSPHRPASLRDVVFVDPWTPPSPVPRGSPMGISPSCPQHGRLLLPGAGGGGGGLSLPSRRRGEGGVRPGGGLLNGLSGDRYTARLAFTLGMCKILCGVVIVMLGMAALVLQATLAGIGAGLWAGTITLLSGVVALMSSKLPRNYAVLIALLCWAITSLASSGLLVIFSGTGLAKDLTDLHRMEANGTDPARPLSGNDTVQSRVVNGTDGVSERWSDSVFGSPLHMAFFTNRRPAVVVNAVLVTLATVDCLMAIACITLAGAEACPCGAPVAGCGPGGGDGSGRWELAWYGTRNDRKARQDRLLHWIDQQQIHLLWQNCPPSYQKPVTTATSSTCPRNNTGPSGHHTCSSMSHSCFSHDTLNSDLYSKVSSNERHYARIRVLPSAVAAPALSEQQQQQHSSSQELGETNDTGLTDEQILSSYSELDKRLAEDFIRRLDGKDH